MKFLRRLLNCFNGDSSGRQCLLKRLVALICCLVWSRVEGGCHEGMKPPCSSLLICTPLLNFCFFFGLFYFSYAKLGYVCGGSMNYP